jgi:hypothetical protein
LDGKKDEKTNNTRTICVFSSNRALIGWKIWMRNWTISYSVQFQQIGRCIGRKNSWMRKWTILWPHVCFHQICFYWMNYMDEKAFFFPPFWQYITSKTKGWSAFPSRRLNVWFTPCSMKVQLFHWWNFVHIHQWNCIHWKFMNDIFLIFIHGTWLTLVMGGKNKIGMNYTWWMKPKYRWYFLNELYLILKFHEYSSIDFHSFIKINTKKTWNLNSKPFNLLSICFKNIFLASNLKNYLIVLIFLFGWFPNFNWDLLVLTWFNWTRIKENFL